MKQSPVFDGVRVAQSLVFCVVFSRSLFVHWSFLIWSLYCLSLFGHCIACPSLVIVLPVILWSLYCLSFFGHCIVCPSLVIVLPVILWSLYCLSFFGHCIVCHSLVIVLSVLLWFTVSAAALISSNFSWNHNIIITDTNLLQTNKRQWELVKCNNVFRR